MCRSDEVTALSSLNRRNSKKGEKTMNSKLLKRFIVIAVLVMVGALILPLGWSAAAHSKADDDPEAKLEGTWRVQVTLHNCQTGATLISFPSLLTFAQGHTLIEVTSSPAFLPGQRTPGLGVWSRTDGRTFSAESDAFILFPSVATPPGFKRGVQRINQTIEVNGDDFAANASNQFFDANGIQYDSGCATVVGHRF
jgi:hypothetical protein